MARMFGLFLRDLYPEGRCLAIKKNGIPCKIRGAVYLCKNGKLRCKWHGGLSTGAKTPEGREKANRVRREGWERDRERIMKALRDGNKAWRARQRAEKAAKLERDRASRERRRLSMESLLLYYRSITGQYWQRGGGADIAAGAALPGVTRRRQV